MFSGLGVEVIRVYIKRRKASGKIGNTSVKTRVGCKIRSFVGKSIQVQYTNSTNTVIYVSSDQKIGGYIPDPCSEQVKC